MVKLITDKTLDIHTAIELWSPPHLYKTLKVKIKLFVPVILYGRYKCGSQREITHPCFMP